MWIRMRLDIAWRDLLAGAGYCMLPGKQSRAVSAAERSWSDSGDALIALSVRSAFDLTLRALQLPEGSEVLLTALTVPDMIRIVELHGLVPVPVDVDEHGNVDPISLRRSISERTRMFVVAHLFGGRASMDDIVEITRPHELLLVEDCAQSFGKVGEGGHAHSDIVMHSFGPIKTATSLGGAVVRVASPSLRQRMEQMLNGDPLQSRANFARRIARFALLKALSGNLTASLFCHCARRLGCDVDRLINSLGRGFAASQFVERMRRRPSTPLVRLMRRRWKRYDFARIDRRGHLGRRLDRQIAVCHSPDHSYWVYPLFTPQAVAIRERLRAAGFDATCLSRMALVPPIDDSRVPVTASENWEHVLFVPWYPDLTDEAVDRMAELIQC